jgi:hypothetical protein
MCLTSTLREGLLPFGELGSSTFEAEPPPQHEAPTAPTTACRKTVSEHLNDGVEIAETRSRNGQARRRVRDRLSSGQSYAATSATICCATTLSG